MPKQLGRPRAVSAIGETDPREDILTAASRLFSTAGYAKATTREIASAVGLRQASLFYYFPSKVELFAELLDRSVAPALDLARSLGEVDARAEMKLYAVTYGDTLNLCSHPWAATAPWQLPEARDERFNSFWAKRDELFDNYFELCRESLRPEVMDPVMATRIVYGLVESVASWYGRDGGEHSPTAVSDAIASSALLTLGWGVEKLPALRREARSLGVGPFADAQRESATASP